MRQFKVQWWPHDNKTSGSIRRNRFLTSWNNSINEGGLWPLELLYDTNVYMERCGNQWHCVEKKRVTSTTVGQVYKSKVISVTGHGGLHVCEMLRIPHFLDSRLTDCSMFANLTHRQRFTLQKCYFSASGPHLCQRLRKLQGLVPLKGLGKLKKKFHFSGSRTHDLPVSSIVPQPLR
jgi:hypothetical protein